MDEQWSVKKIVRTTDIPWTSVPTRPTHLTTDPKRTASHLGSRFPMWQGTLDQWTGTWLVRNVRAECRGDPRSPLCRLLRCGLGCRSRCAPLRSPSRWLVADAPWHSTLWRSAALRPGHSIKARNNQHFRSFLYCSGGVMFSQTPQKMFFIWTTVKNEIMFF